MLQNLTICKETSFEYFQSISLGNDRMYLADPLQLWHPQEQLPELRGNVRVVGRGVDLQGADDLLLGAADAVGLLQAGGVCLE